jgi:chromosome segregation ATPase
LRAERNRIQARLEEALVEKDQLQSYRSRVAIDLERLRSEQQWTSAELNAKKAELEEYKYQYYKILYSKSYRLTQPLRAIYTFASKIRNRIRSSDSRPAGTLSGATVPATPGGVEDLDEDEQFFRKFFARQINLLRKKNGKSS